MSNATKTVIIIIALVMSSTIVYEFYTIASHPQYMRVREQKAHKRSFIVNAINSVTIILFKNDRIYCYAGYDIANGQQFSFTGNNSIHEFLLQRTKDGDVNDVRFIIKSASTASYKTTVNILDELTKNDIKKYSIIDISAEEEKFVNEL